ncbi:SigB/SigF/SigG family RNA polymerase sigma factor [Mycobacteroides chelonae]|uniref:SigB/SigF/SigG family RNA polymerase sigma factor n=1 Tax=Mycobacteroides chelonae TaxID=1774 RepID=UPI0009BEB2B1|nr:SigB/SigF/SigG family RNA polymerase sigma factor [Mycobacteroides chelonae]
MSANGSSHQRGLPGLPSGSSAPGLSRPELVRSQSRNLTLDEADSPGRTYRHDYNDVANLISVLRSLPSGSLDYRRQLERIITLCLPLADNIAWRFARRGQEHEDLVQVARLGLLHAVNRFDATKGGNFLAFAVPTMMGEVRRHFRDLGWSVHVPRSIRDRHVQITQLISKLSHELRRAPTASELATALQISLEDVVEVLAAADAYRPQSLDGPVRRENGDTEQLTAKLGGSDMRLERVVDLETLRASLANLPPRDRAALELRFFGGLTQSQIATRIGVSQMHVSRILTSTLNFLREEMNK